MTMEQFREWEPTDLTIADIIARNVATAQLLGYFGDGLAQLFFLRINSCAA